MGVAELSRTGARSTAAPTTSLVDAVQGMTRAALTDGNVYAPTQNLPRDPLDLSPFGPLAPLFIQAINPPRADTGRPEPRVWEYPQGFNLPGGGDRLIPWQVLRDASVNVDIIRRCIEIRKDDVRALKTSWRISDDAVKAAQEADPTRPRDEIEAELRKQFAPDIKRLTSFWARPWITNGVRFGQWVAAVMEDHIALDAVAIYPITSVGGDVIGFRVVDGTTMKLLINDLGERPQPPHPAFQQSVYGFPRGEFIADVVLREDGTEDTSSLFTASQITYWRENFRTYTPYGFSQVEQALVSAALYLKRQGWMHAEYDEGSTPLTWLIPQGDKFVANQLSPAQRREYETAINDDLEGQTGKRHRIKVSYPGYQPEQMDSVDERYKPDYDLFLLKLVSSHLGVTLDRLGFTETKGLGATGQHERQKEVQDDSGVNPDAAMLTDLIMELSRNYLDCPLELVFEFSKDKNEDEAAKDAVNAARRTRGAITQNEDRKSLGLTPLDIPEADMPSMVTATGIVYIEGGADQQAAMNELAANPPAPGVPGAPGGGRPGPGGGGAGAGGSRPKPSGPRPSGGPKPTKPTQPAAPKNKAAADAEVLAYHRWLRKNADGLPRRPFQFEHATPDDLAGVGVELDGAWQAFDGYEWRQDINKDWRSWNAEHPLHPRGPHGRFVKVGNLIDELKRTGGPISEHHENAFDEATRRALAGRHIKRGESQLADDLERRGLLEELGGPGRDKGRLSVSEAGRQHIEARYRAADEAAAVGSVPEEHVPSGEPEPANPHQERIDWGQRIQALSDIASEVEELHGNEAEPDILRHRVRQLASRYTGRPGGGEVAALASEVEAAQTTEQMRDLARSFAERHGLERIGDAGAVVRFDPKHHQAIGGAPAPGTAVDVVRPGHATHDDSPLTLHVTGGEPRVVVRRAVVIESDRSITPEPALTRTAASEALFPASEGGTAMGARWTDEQRAAMEAADPGLEPKEIARKPRTRRTTEERYGQQVTDALFPASEGGTPGLAKPAEKPRDHFTSGTVEQRLAELTPTQRVRKATEDELAQVRADLAASPEGRKRERLEFRQDQLVSQLDDIERQEARRLAADRDREQGFGTLPASTAPPAYTPAAVPAPQPAAENAVGQTAEDRLRQAEVMYGSDRSKWPAHAKRDAARLERQAARKPKAAPVEPSAGGGQVTDSSGNVVAMEPEDKSLIGNQYGEWESTPAPKRFTSEQLRELPWGGATREQIIEHGRTHGLSEADIDAELADLWHTTRERPSGAAVTLNTVGSAQSRQMQERKTYLREQTPKILGAALGDGPTAVTHAPSRAILESMRDRGWSIVDVDTNSRTITFRKPGAEDTAAGRLTMQVTGNGKTPVWWQGQSKLTLRRAGEIAEVPEKPKVARKPRLTSAARAAKDAELKTEVDSLLGRTPAPEPVKSGAERQLEMQTGHYQRMIAQAEELDTQINFAETDSERRQLETRRSQLDQQMAALDRQIQAARKAVPRAQRQKLDRVARLERELAASRAEDARRGLSGPSARTFHTRTDLARLKREIAEGKD